jgi:hypothetical protein
MREQVTADPEDDPLPDVVHQVAREVGADALQQVRDQQGPDDESQPVLRRQDIVHDRLDQPGGGRRCAAVDHHRQHRARDESGVRAGVTEQPQEGVHQARRRSS